MYNLFIARKNKGVSQEAVANFLSISRVTYTRYENGSRHPDNETLVKLADYFGVSTDFLLEKTKSPHDDHWRWIPILSNIPAGVPMEAIDYIIGYVEMPIDKFPNQDLYSLRVESDSMEPRIENGDIVIFRPQSDAETGQVVIVRVNGHEATLKRLKKMDDGIMLIPNNQPKYEPMFFNKEQIASLPVEIIGVVIELRGRFK
ncbi:MAG: S24 family peptidase [Methanobacterium sp.]